MYLFLNVTPVSFSMYTGHPVLKPNSFITYMCASYSACLTHYPIPFSISWFHLCVMKLKSPEGVVLYSFQKY